MPGKIVDIDIASAGRNAVVLNWAYWLDPYDLADNVSNYSVHVSYSEHPEVGYSQPISVDLSDKEVKFEGLKHLSQLGFLYYWKVELYRGQELLETKLIWLKPKPDGIANVFREKYEIAMKYVLRKTARLYMQRITEGACPECVDIRTGDPIAEECESCLGSRKKGGYWDPVEIWINPDPEVFTDDNSLVSSDRTMRNFLLPFYPSPREKDIVYFEEEGVLYMINNLVPNVRSGGYIYIIASVIALPRDHVAYKLLEP